MQFRKTCENDIDRIMDILAHGRAVLAAMGIDQWQGGYPHRGIIEADVSRGESFVVVDESGAPQATAMLSFAGEPVYDLILDGAWLTDSVSAHPCYGVIHRVAVGADCKGQGMGSRLLGCVEDCAREHGCASVRVDTHAGNAPMQRLLEKRGYQRCGTVMIDHAEGATPERIGYEKLL